MDAEQKRALKKLGKAEVERRSAELRAALEEANPGGAASEDWASGYRDGVERERWLKKALPILSRAQLEELFVVLPDNRPGWVPHPGGYILCAICGSAVPSVLPRRLFYWRSCVCGNIKWRCLLGFGRGSAREPDAIVSVKLLGRSKGEPSGHSR